MNRSITKGWGKPATLPTMNSLNGTPSASGATTPMAQLQTNPLGNGEVESPMKSDRQANGEPKSKRRKAEREVKRMRIEHRRRTSRWRILEEWIMSLRS